MYEKIMENAVEGPSLLLIFLFPYMFPPSKILSKEKCFLVGKETIIENYLFPGSPYFIPIFIHTTHTPETSVYFCI